MLYLGLEICGLPMSLFSEHSYKNTWEIMMVFTLTSQIQFVYLNLYVKGNLDKSIHQIWLYTFKLELRLVPTSCVICYMKHPREGKILNPASPRKKYRLMQQFESECLCASSFLSAWHKPESSAMVLLQFAHDLVSESYE